ncbi:MAG: type II secretion system protein GspM [Actinomycetota bacterium]|nr:type II secretion system protein GspM [Actinomycetota bacterium]
MTTRDRTVLMVVATLALVVGSWLLVIQPKRNQASKLGAQVTAAQAQLTAARSQVAAGEAARSSYASYYTELARLGEAVPADDNVPSLIYQLQQAATSTGTDFRNLALASSSPSTPAPAAAAGTAAPAPAGVLPPGVSIGPAGLPIEPFTFTFNGNFFHLANFLGRLERFVVAKNDRLLVSGRLMSLNAISLQPGPNGFPQISASINATTYLTPQSQSPLGGAAPAGPSASSSQPVSSSGSASPAPSAAVTPPVR